MKKQYAWLVTLGCISLLSILIISGLAAGESRPAPDEISFLADGGAEETKYMYDDQSSGIWDADNHRFADERKYWIYSFTFSDLLATLTVDLRLGGQFLVEASTDGESWVEVASHPVSLGELDIRSNLTSLVKNSSDQLYLKFSDRVKTDGLGASLWRLGLSYTLQNGESGTVPAGPETKRQAEVNSFSFRADGGSQEAVYMYENKSSMWDADMHRFADNQQYWIYFFRFNDDIAHADLKLDINGQYKVSVSTDLSAWTTLFAENSSQGRRELTADITSYVTNGNQSLYVKFEDQEPSDGFGPALWNIGFDYKLESGLSGSNPSGPVSNVVSFDALGGNIESKYMVTNDGSAIDAKRGYRYADWSSSWIYGFSFYDAVTRAIFTLNTGGEYRILVSTDRENWTEMRVADGNPDLATIDIDAGSLLGPSTKQIFIKFADRDTETGFGPRLSNLKLTYMLQGGQPDTAPLSAR